MRDWEKALDRFVKPWKLKKEVIGILACGSYITGNPGKRSDIDVHIILDDNTKWRERGNKMVDEFLIEYFANPPKQIRKYFEHDFKDNETMSEVQFSTGKILFDEKGHVSKLKKEAKTLLSKKFKKINRNSMELAKYFLWDRLDNLEDAFEKNAQDFEYTYHNSLKKIYETYAKSIGEIVTSDHNMIGYLTDARTRKKYEQKEFKDDQFRRLFLKAMVEKDRVKMIKIYRDLTNHALKKMGGFEIDGWKMRSSLDKS